MSVERFDPNAARFELDSAAIAALCALAPRGDALDLPRAEVLRFAPACKSDGWPQAAKTLGDEEINGLIRLFTLGEERFPEWSAGAKSPVIALVRELKARGTYDVTITRWIKAHTSNRFLPHGNVLDRL